MKNPFQYGKIAEKDNFIDRNLDRAFLKQSLNSNQNVILMSPRRWGKSSLVKQAMSELMEEDKNVRVVHIDAFPITSSYEFYNIFAREVLKAISNHTQSIIDNIGRFLKGISPKISLSLEPMSEFSISFDFDNGEIDERTILNLPEKIAKEKGLQIIVCIDEFQKLAKLPDYEKLESLMRSVWQHQQSVSYCLYGSQRHMMDDIFNSPQKPFFRFGQMYNLNKIAADEWVKYIVDRFESTGKRISDELAFSITKIADSHSWYVQQLSSAVWNFSNDEATADSIKNALVWCIDVNSEAFQNLCDNMTASQIGLLKAIVAGEEQLTSANVISKYHLGTSASVIKNKRTFKNEDIIIFSKHSKPQFIDPIFKAWFRQCYQS